jgi:hypothetical protein
MSIFWNYNANSQEMASPIENPVKNIVKDVIWHLFADRESHQVLKITVTLSGYHKTLVLRFTLFMLWLGT